jgi:hypothetical protein
MYGRRRFIIGDDDVDDDDVLNEDVDHWRKLL